MSRQLLGFLDCRPALYDQAHIGVSASVEVDLATGGVLGNTSRLQVNTEVTGRMGQGVEFRPVRGSLEAAIWDR